jgi:sec-independent protein translocase protein TatC
MALEPADLGSIAQSEFHTREQESTDERSRMSFLEHLDELRRRILYSLYAFIACACVTFYYWDRLYAYFINYFHALGGSMIYTQPMAGFMFSLKLSALVALIVASPFIFSQLWMFVAPGLYAKEKKVVLPFVGSSTLLFVGGAWFAHRIAFPSMWRFFASYEIPGLSYMPNLDLAFGLYVKVILGLGLVFQMPVLVFFLARFGLLTAGFMLRKFKYAVLIIVVVAAVITPSGDPVNLTVFSAPMLILYVFSIGVAWLFGKKRREDEEAF